jgi:Fur family ferric uptake transcriptional regulator
LIINNKREIIYMLRMTHQREVILEELDRCRSHPTADELYALVRSRLPRISLATVYRNLEQMSEAGLVKKLAFAGCQNHFDGNVKEHNHIRCRVCGKVADLEAVDSFAPEHLVPGDCGYEDVSCLVEFTGICPACSGRKNL